MTSITSWEIVVAWGIKLKRKSLRNTLYKLCWQYSVYNLWLDRNARIRTLVSKDHDDITQLILQDVRLRALRLPFLASQFMDSSLAAVLGFNR